VAATMSRTAKASTKESAIKVLQALDLTEERVLLPVLAQLCPGTWRGLRRLSQSLKRALSDRFLQAALEQLPVLRPGENLCRRLAAMADGSVVVLARGKHRWTGKLSYSRRLRIFGVPGAVVHGKVHLASDSSGSFYDVQFRNAEGSAVRIQEAEWVLHRCSIQCVDTDASALTLVSSDVVLHQCEVNTEELKKTCWLGILAKGCTRARLRACEVGPNLQRGVVAVNDAEVSILQCHLHGCEEIGCRLDGSARLHAAKSRIAGSGVALQCSLPSAKEGSLELNDCTISSFQSLWGGYYRPMHLVMVENSLVDVGGDSGAAHPCDDTSDEA